MSVKSQKQPDMSRAAIALGKMRMIGAQVGSLLATEATPVSSTAPVEKESAEKYGALASIITVAQGDTKFFSRRSSTRSTAKIKQSNSQEMYRTVTQKTSTKQPRPQPPYDVKVKVGLKQHLRKMIKFNSVAGSAEDEEAEIDGSYSIKPP